MALGAALLTALKTAEPALQSSLDNRSDRSYGLGERVFTLLLLFAGLGIWHGLW